ncbi:MAG: hypothetical protein AAF441_10010 [Pseudomonadota bacterium]
MTLALNTKLEEEFVAPLTAVRGALEILRDYPEINEDERLRFVSTALRSCHLLERAVHDLADTVYAAGRSEPDAPEVSEDIDEDGYVRRVKLHPELHVMELDFSGLVFSNSQIVYDVYDVVDAAIRRSGQKWYFLINMTECSIWPEAWVAFAHRGKKVAVNHAHGTVRFAEGSSPSGVTAGGSDTPVYPSRDSALAQIMRWTEERS